MDLISLLLPLLSGAMGGNLVGGLVKSCNLGAAGNSVAGLVGGGVGSVALAGAFGSLSSMGVDPASAALIEPIIGGAIGGGVLTILTSVLDNLFARKR